MNVEIHLFVVFVKRLTCFCCLLVLFLHSAQAVQVDIPPVPKIVNKSKNVVKKSNRKTDKKVINTRDKKKKKTNKLKKNVNSNKETNKKTVKKQRKKNVKKIEKMDFLDDKVIVELLDEQERMTASPKGIAVRVRNKGVPKFCLTKNDSVNQSAIRSDDNEEKKIVLLKEAKEGLKQHIKNSLVVNNVSEDLIDYLMGHFTFVKQTKVKHKQIKKRSVVEQLERYDNKSRIKLGIFYAKMYQDTLKEVDELFAVDKALILTIWSMETNYGSNIGSSDAFNALYSACMNAENMQRLRYFEENIIALAMLVDKGYFKRDVVSSFDGGLGGCQFMPSSFYKFAVSMHNDKPDIINNNSDVFASIGNYMHSMGWRYGEGILTEVEVPDENFDLCLAGMNTSKSITEWLELGIKPHKKGVGLEYLEHTDAKASLIITDIDDKDIDVKNKRAFLVYDNFKVVLGYNQYLWYAINAGLLFEMIKNGKSK